LLFDSSTTFRKSQSHFVGLVSSRPPRRY
jgi:hypothetical protein